MYFTRWQSGWLVLQSSVYRMNSKALKEALRGEALRGGGIIEDVFNPYTYIIVYPQNELVIRVEAGGKFLCQNVGAGY